MAKRAAVYLRISKDEDNDRLGIERQRSSVEHLAKARGWRIDPAWVIEENNVSASKKKRRPGFERLLVGIRAGEFDVVMAYALDRLVRGLIDTQRLIDLAEEFGVPVTTVAGDIDLSTGQGRGMAKMLGVVASIETDNMGQRMRDKKRQNAENGIVRAGGRRPYGFTANRSATVPEEAAIILEVSQRILDGASLTGIVLDLNKRGVPTSYGSTWTLPRLQNTLSRPSLCGRVSYKGEVLRDSDDEPVRGEWDPILTDRQFDELQIAVEARRHRPKEWSQERKHLLAGLARCGYCGAAMIGFKTRRSRWTYVCAAQRHLSRVKDPVDAYVIERVKAKATETVFEIDSWSDEEAEQVRKKIAILEARKREAALQFADGSVGADVLRTIVNEIDRQIDVLRASQVGQVIEQQTADAVNFDLAGLDDMPVAEAHAAILMFVQRITIQPAGKGQRRFNPDLIDIEWRDLDAFKWRGVVEASLEVTPK